MRSRPSFQSLLVLLLGAMAVAMVTVLFRRAVEADGGLRLTVGDVVAIVEGAIIVTVLCVYLVVTRCRSGRRRR